MAVMQINRKIDYALRAVIYLTCRESSNPCAVGEIARNEEVPKKFLEKIIQDLIRSGLVRSHRGPRGGYTLARDPGEVTFKDIVEAVDGPVSLNICVSETDECEMMPNCGMHWVWEEGQRRVMELFARTTLADMRDGQPGTASSHEIYASQKVGGSSTNTSGAASSKRMSAMVPAPGRGGNHGK